MEYRIEHDSMGKSRFRLTVTGEHRPREASRTSLLEQKRSPWK